MRKHTTVCDCWTFDVTQDYKDSPGCREGDSRCGLNEVKGGRFDAERRIASSKRCTIFEPTRRMCASVAAVIHEAQIATQLSSVPNSGKRHFFTDKSNGAGACRMFNTSGSSYFSSLIRVILKVDYSAGLNGTCMSVPLRWVASLVRPDTSAQHDWTRKGLVQQLYMSPHSLIS